MEDDLVKNNVNLINLWDKALENAYTPLEQSGTEY